MPTEQPWLRKQLLVWLLVPLTLLLIADAFVSYWITLDFARRAYDRSLIEIAHEIALHLRGSDAGLELDMPEAARRVLLTDPSDKVYFGITAADGRPVAGALLPGPSRAIARGPRDEAVYDGWVDNHPVRLVEYRSDATSGHPPAVVRVAETQIKRNDLAREMLLSVIVPQVLLILLAGILVWGGVARGPAPLVRLQRAVAARSPYDLSPVGIAEVPGEVRPLLRSINVLLERLGRGRDAGERSSSEGYGEHAARLGAHGCAGDGDVCGDRCRQVAVATWRFRGDRYGARLAAGGCFSQPYASCFADG